ncbi:MAG: L-threonylcarbamoyladenylate synthase [Candidatus Neomarinimicrobiota bacterium]|nr:L-threonylcarbamoyladenylate synthase [Candidatus Neomarinimicrobiota bacterium]
MKRISSDTPETINAVCDILSKGNVVVYPTDTLYGFGGDAVNGDAIKKINQIKGRTAPLSVLAPDRSTALSWMKLTEDEKILVSKKLGGAATIIVPVFKDIVHSSITGEYNTLGIRIPYHSFCQQLARKFGGPITTTSVNRTGDPPMTDPNHIYSEFKHEVDLLIDDGIISGRGSAIYIYKHGKLKIMRS